MRDFFGLIYDFVVKFGFLRVVLGSNFLSGFERRTGEIGWWGWVKIFWIQVFWINGVDWVGGGGEILLLSQQNIIHSNNCKH